jgi:hypothetical protein
MKYPLVVIPAGTLWSRARPLARLFVCPALFACHTAGPKTGPAPAPPDFSIAWPVPPGWKSETIPFPLDFAPELTHRGIEEVRFAPHFFEPAAETYFTYSFAWMLSDDRRVTPDVLQAELPIYFRGLARAVGEEKHVTYDPSAFSAHVEAVDATHARGTVRSVDPFGDGRPLTLNLDAEWRTCGARQAVLVSLSPRPPGNAIWQSLIEQRSTFRCE